MFPSTTLVFLLLLIPFVSAGPTDVAERATAIDTTSHCSKCSRFFADPSYEPNLPSAGLFDTVVAGSYSHLLNQWSASGATSGSHCANLVSLTGMTVAWKITWTKDGGTGVKSFTNIDLDTGINQKLSAISTIPTTWVWSQSTTSVVADVAYDMFTANTAGGAAVKEIMVWLANFNAGPISANLTTNRGISTAQFLTTLQGGTEATSGSATLTTSAFNLVIN
ncbi:glycoside hydrolase family 12 protein [Mycena maculata]|uniref:Glycoside hydrolase family 12 protein n=1 Tax=Mycena maculata TaxID=230809 RepID=A0AAD7ICH5_9AGAR|nr:glycoside hydrolase family 12 protein [Mycena maculata]